VFSIASFKAISDDSLTSHPTVGSDKLHHIFRRSLSTLKWTKIGENVKQLMNNIFDSVLYMSVCQSIQYLPDVSLVDWV